jgi:hypothetical protein
MPRNYLRSRRLPLSTGDSRFAGLEFEGFIEFVAVPLLLIIGTSGGIRGLAGGCHMSRYWILWTELLEKQPHHQWSCPAG